jgi:hypothetical protein
MSASGGKRTFNQPEKYEIEGQLSAEAVNLNSGHQMGTRNDDAILGCQPERFVECYAQRVCHLVEEVDLQYVDLGVAFDDIPHCLHNLASVLGFELALHATQVFAQIR